MHPIGLVCFLKKQIFSPLPQRFWLKCRLLGPISDQLNAYILVWFWCRLFKDYILMWLTARFLNHSKQCFLHITTFIPSKKIQWLLIYCLLSQAEIPSPGKESPPSKGLTFLADTSSYYSGKRTSIICSLLSDSHCPFIPTLQNLMVFFFPAFENLAMLLKLNNSLRLGFSENCVGGERVGE